MGIWERLTGQSRSSQSLASAYTNASEAGAGGFAVIDVETTGLSPQQHRILEVAVVQTDISGRPQSEWTTRINPQGPVGATHIHGITADDVRHAPPFEVVIPHVISLLRGRVLVAHNASFDMAFLNREFARANWSWPDAPCLCTMREAGYFLSHLHRRRLPDCCEASGIRLSNAHSALSDARATSILLRSYLDPNFGPPPLPHHLELPRAALGTRWPHDPLPTGQHPPASPAPPPHAPLRSPRRSSSFTTAVPLVAQVSSNKVLASGAPDYTVGYIEVLLNALEDGSISEEERESLDDIASGMALDEGDVYAAHLGIAHALAAAAVEDGTVTKAERTELKLLLTVLGFEEKESAGFLSDARRKRCERLSAGLSTLPGDWSLGEPLRVGDNVVFTGCDPLWRERHEQEAHQRGVQVASGVSKKTAMLVSDGSFSGTKADKAAALGTRVVHPRYFETLLRHIQPYME